MVGNGRAAKKGILFKNAAALEEAGKVKIVALDKTGTITAGEPKVTDICPAEGISEKQLLQMAYSLEKGSEHPLAKAILQKAEEEGMENEEVTEFQALPGNGLEAVRVADQAKLVGGSFMYIQNLSEVSATMIERAEKLAEEGKINEAENELYEGMVEDDVDYLELALTFYLYLNDMDGDFLDDNGYSREEVLEGMKDLASDWGVSGLEAF